jgi:hypothetical protein
MKKLLLIVAVVVSATLKTSAQRCEKYLTLTTQHDIDTLSAATKSCIIRGITVSGPGIINLTGLSGIDSIAGPLYINNNPDLLNLDGLTGLTQVEGEIDINNNLLITNLNGLSSLSSVGNNVRAVDNPALTSITGLSNLTTIPGFLSVGRNAKLPSLSGLENIATVYGAIAFGANPLMTNLDALSGLQYIGGFLYIGENPALTSLAGLIHVKAVYGYINIENNDALTTLAGLDSIDYTTPEYLQINNSNVLSFCNVKSVCDYIRFGGAVQISGNATGCNTSTEIGAACAAFPVELVSFSGSNNREGNSLKWETSLEINNRGFELQKSRNGKSFEVLAFIPGNGDSKENHHYEQWDNAPYPITYYRLKQIDEDGTFSYSRLVAVKDNFSQFRTDVQAINIYPNPVKDKLTIKVEKPDQPFSIRNAEGRIIKTGKFVPSEPIDVSKVTNGLHFITVGSETFKVLINN